MILFLNIAFFFTSCAAPKPAKQEQRIWQFFVEGTVQAVKGEQLVLALKLPEFKRMPESPIHEIARLVAEKSLFLAGTKTDIDGAPAIIKEVLNNLLTIALDVQKTYTVGANVKIKIPMKTIAIMDFEVIRGQEKEIGRVILEELTSVLIETGYFIVVERAKLKTILTEHELSQTGLTKEPAEKIVGKLLTADLILTGALAEIGSLWDINLRLVDVRTGQALAAIAVKTPLAASLATRNAELNEDFSKRPSPSWLLGHRTSKGGFYAVSWDRNTGVKDSRGSLKIDFDYPGGLSRLDGYAGMMNLEKRDLSFCSGIEFYIRATRPLTGIFSTRTSLPNEPIKQDSWMGYFDIETDWKKVEIPFKKLTISQSWVGWRAKSHGFKLGDQIFRAHQIEAIEIFILAGENQPVNGKTAGSIWVDKIRSYK